MKTIANSTRRPVASLYTKLALVSLLALIGLAGCKKSEDVVPATGFEGNYEVQGRSAAENYIIGVTKHDSKANTFNISNFGDFMKVPVVMEVSGEEFNIPSQNFKSGNSQITVTGTGKATGGVLAFRYSLRGFTNFDSDAITAKKVR